MEKSYRIIGDIHGRTNWRELIDFTNPDVIYIFLGDYTDPYYANEPDVTPEQMLEVIDELITLKKMHPDNVILLWGNHDMQYIIGMGDTNRFSMKLYPTLHTKFIENEEWFHGIAYNIGEKYLISHAGVTKNWYCDLRGQKYTKGETTLKEVAQHINDIWEGNKDVFTFQNCCTKFSDYYGTSATHSPLWIRPSSLWEYNLFGFNSGIIQVVGHTISQPLKNIATAQLSWGKIGTLGTNYGRELSEEEISNGYWINDGEHVCKIAEDDPDKVDIILCDCLATETACIEIDKELNWRKITPEDIRQEDKQ